MRTDRSSQRENSSSDCDRRDFLKWTTGAAASAAALSALPAIGRAAPQRDSAAETAVREFYATLTDEQKTVMALPFEDERRTRISANWSITPAKIGGFTKAQQELIHKIVKGATSEDGYERFLSQMKHDNGGIEKYSVAIFGNPEETPYAFELTGRHLTLRADGDTTTGVAFGGPIVYGHGAAGNSEKNLFSYQTRRVNEVFAALDEKQRTQALQPKSPSLDLLQVGGEKRKRSGIAGSDLSSDQQELLLSAFADVLAPYRKEDVDEVMSLVKDTGGVEKMNVTFFQAGDLGEDKVWDMWRIEGPAVVCDFRGAPHVHAYINVAKV
ncbi:DUF3500 domain-containing protein [Lignipirellula cremea]|uniref:DUF3500 domain-containing protein n=1 Tax=Lignipirellula cremea TaxID=2528010 RepID=A0A518DYE1_9BACT|nr:DUF3500 domain-containing protein [Lignipirellula cremea]QDU96863.1 hypothetical protein Pla8534_46850 [Lignipirellula cremea]